jgi:hypothetical protein
MLRLPHTAGSPAAQRDLQAIGGWTRPTRRSVLTGILALGAVPAAAALPPVEADPEVNPYSSGLPANTVSPRMAELVGNAVRLTAIAEALSAAPDTPAADAADDAVAVLVNESPTSLADLAAKLTAISQTMKDDCGTSILNRLAQDAVALVGEAK